MSKDPAFLFYDGDAARDVSHMNRLERGCYFDLIQAQRKFGRLSINLIKKILGKDFETCWEGVKICLSYDNHMYYIIWLEDSTKKREKYSESRRKNRMSENEAVTNNICESYDPHILTHDSHMENENNNSIIDSSSSIVDSSSTVVSKEKEEGEKLQKRFKDFITKHCPRLFKMTSPITLDDYKKLLARFSKDDIKAVFIEMDNWKPLLKKNVSAYKTALNWLNRRTPEDVTDNKPIIKNLSAKELYDQ